MKLIYKSNGEGVFDISDNQELTREQKDYILNEFKKTENSKMLEKYLDLVEEEKRIIEYKKIVLGSVRKSFRDFFEENFPELLL